MTVALQRLLESFDALPDADKHEAAVEILRRGAAIDGDLPEAGLVEAAEELFRMLDDEEAGGASASRGIVNNR